MKNNKQLCRLKVYENELQTEGGEGRTLYFLADSYILIFIEDGNRLIFASTFSIYSTYVSRYSVYRPSIDGKDTPPTPLSYFLLLGAHSSLCCYYTINGK